MRAAVFLDRDGTLNRSHPTRDGATTRPPGCLGELRLVEGAAEACARLRAAGFALLVVTNQPDVARGTQSRGVADAISGAVVSLLRLDGVAARDHDDRDRCRCRKPAPGLILELARRHRVDVARSWMVGDRASDIAAGRGAGCRTVLVSTEAADHGQDHGAPSLSAAADFILAQPIHRTHPGSRYAS